MPTIGIYECGNGTSRALDSAFCVYGIHDAQVRHANGGECFDAVVIDCIPPKSCSACGAEILIAPDCVSAQSISGFTARSVVSYGLCAKNTLTVSSFIGSRLVVSVQREIAALSGARIGEQEFCVRLENADNLERMLAVLAALLVSGVSPEALSEAHFGL